MKCVEVTKRFVDFWSLMFFSPNFCVKSDGANSTINNHHHRVIWTTFSARHKDVCCEISCWQFPPCLICSLIDHIFALCFDLTFAFVIDRPWTLFACLIFVTVFLETFPCKIFPRNRKIFFLLQRYAFMQLRKFHFADKNRKTFHRRFLTPGKSWLGIVSRRKHFSFEEISEKHCIWHKKKRKTWNSAMSILRAESSMFVAPRIGFAHVSTSLLMSLKKIIFLSHNLNAFLHSQ